MPGQSDFITNLSVGYEKYGFSGRFSLIFQGATQRGVAITGGQDENNDSFLRFDVAASQKLTKGISVFLNVNNLYDESDVAFFGPFVRRQEFFGWTGDLGIRYKF